MEYIIAYSLVSAFVLISVVFLVAERRARRRYINTLIQKIKSRGHWEINTQTGERTWHDPQ